jgi:transcriptional regulator with XRE-family HTH domain
VANNLGKRIRQARKDAGLAQEAVARRADVGVNVISRIERGTITDPHYSTLSGIARALDTTVAELVGEEESAGVPLAS